MAFLNLLSNSLRCHVQARFDVTFESTSISARFLFRLHFDCTLEFTSNSLCLLFRFHLTITSIITSIPSRLLFRIHFNVTCELTFELSPTWLSNPHRVCIRYHFDSVVLMRLDVASEFTSMLLRFNFRNRFDFTFGVTSMSLRFSKEHFQRKCAIFFCGGWEPTGWGLPSWGRLRRNWDV